MVSIEINKKLNVLCFERNRREIPDMDADLTPLLDGQSTSERLLENDIDDAKVQKNDIDPSPVQNQLPDNQEVDTLHQRASWGMAQFANYLKIIENRLVPRVKRGAATSFLPSHSTSTTSTSASLITSFSQPVLSSSQSTDDSTVDNGLLQQTSSRGFWWADYFDYYSSSWPYFSSLSFYGDDTDIYDKILSGERDSWIKMLRLFQHNFKNISV